MNRSGPEAWSLGFNIIFDVPVVEREVWLVPAELEVFDNVVVVVVSASLIVPDTLLLNFANLKECVCVCVCVYVCVQVIISWIKWFSANLL